MPRHDQGEQDLRRELLKQLITSPLEALPTFRAFEVQGIMAEFGEAHADRDRARLTHLLCHFALKAMILA
jgi:hypothetical protein